MPLKLGVLFGGQSGEHEVSLMSAASVMKNIDRQKFEIIPIGITKNGHWYLYKGDIDDIQNGNWLDNSYKAILPPDPSYHGLIYFVNGEIKIERLDAVFPVLHGPRGEDGTIQGLLELANIPYVGAGVTSSAVGMDKVFTKKLLEHAGLPIVPYLVFTKKQWYGQSEDVAENIETRLGYPNFVKPANLGSSVGITKVHDRVELTEALNLAARYDRKIIVEKSINCKDVECSVLGNENPRASTVGEIMPAREFYDYQAKYCDTATRLLIPAQLPDEKIEEIRTLAVKAYKVLDCQGMARVDFFYENGTGNVYVNELNTIPGFTHVSMYPKLWEASGLAYGKLLEDLIDLALERFQDVH
ncbi:D-alanine--D-alanine ligase family protein [Calorimonas adulescens]|uniref:D-alanine--D-alanine ligase n=1 Tax=Calorimonas adulescens TaxID=2606906 RepID=A0A5D8QFA7_9THEO|nr:D-alanine--D-alanine ligase family protein [Calorimonas adulescens]TZE82879.1 D-alanine--D-alanine ligase [Calorimonas adulescens]